MQHNGFHYKLGLNIDHRKFNRSECMAGGLHFCNAQSLGHWTFIGNLVADVTVPTYVRTATFENKYKADKIILSNIRRIADMTEWKKEDFVHSMISASVGNIANVKDISDTMKNFIINKCGFAIKHLQGLTDDMKINAIRQNPWSIQFINAPTLEMMILAVTLDGETIKCIKEPLMEVQMSAIHNNWKVIRYIKNPSHEVYHTAMSHCYASPIDIPDDELWARHTPYRYK
jgi:hypothetical protein